MKYSEQKARLSNHAQHRIRQRGYREADLALVREHGTQVEEGFVLTRQDAARARTRLKDELRKIERLKGTAIIELEGTVVTVYRPDRVRFRKLRGARGRPRRRTGSDEVGR